MVQAGGVLAGDAHELSIDAILGEVCGQAAAKDGVAMGDATEGAAEAIGDFAERGAGGRFGDAPALGAAQLDQLPLGAAGAGCVAHEGDDGGHGAVIAEADQIADGRRGTGGREFAKVDGGLPDEPAGMANARRTHGGVAAIVAAGVATGAEAALGDVGDADGLGGLGLEAADGVVDAGHGEGGEVAVAMGIMGANGLEQGEAAFLGELAGVEAAMCGLIGPEAADGEVDQGDVALDQSTLAVAECPEGDGGGGHGGGSCWDESLIYA